MFNGIGPTILIGIFTLLGVGIITGITYFYSKNKSYTLYAALIAAYLFILVMIIASLSTIFPHQFIGRYDELGVPYVYAKSGWTQLMQGWSIWILPVMLSSVLMILITARLSSGVKKVISSDQPTELLHQHTTSFTQMTDRLGKDALKSTITGTVDKLAEALLLISAQEHKIAELTEQLQKNTSRAPTSDENPEDHPALLELQLNALTAENNDLTNKLESCKTELELSHQMFNKLLEYKQNEADS